MGRPSILTEERIDVIVEGLRHGLTANEACRRAKVSRAIYYEWLERGRMEGTGLYAELLRRVREVTHFSAASVDEALRQQAEGFSDKTQDQATYTERLLALAIVARMADVLAALGLPEAKSIRYGTQFQNGFRPDILVEHVDGTWTVFEVKTNMGRRKNRHWAIHNGVGQLLYYLEIFSDERNIPIDRIRLAILADFDADVYLTRAMQKTVRPILYLNVTPFVMGDRDGQGD